MGITARLIRSILNRECKSLGFHVDRPGETLVRSHDGNIYDTIGILVSRGPKIRTLDVDIQLGVYYKDLDSIVARLQGEDSDFPYIVSHLFYNIGDILPEWNDELPYLVTCSEENVNLMCEDIINKIRTYSPSFYEKMHDMNYFYSLLVEDRGWGTIIQELLSVIYIQRGQLNKAIHHYESYLKNRAGIASYEMEFLNNLKRLQTDKEYYAYITSFFKNKF